MKLTINADQAIGALGIKHPVTFQQARLNPGENVDDYAMLGEWNVAGVSPFDPTVVKWDALAGVLAEDQGGRIEEFIAHELVHVRQMQDIGDPREAHRLYQRENQIRGYDDNRFEIEARQLAPRLASLVRLEVEP